MEFFIQHKNIFIVLHALAAAVGLGSVIVTDTLFFRFLKDFKISKKENDTLRSISKLVWVVIGIIFITGLALYLSAPMTYLEKSKFVVKVIIFAVIVLNGFLLNYLITPHLTKILFGPVPIEPKPWLRFVRRVAFASGALSITSWLSVFILGSVRSIPLTVVQGLIAYLAIAGGAILGSQLYAGYIKHWNVKR